ncbi:indole-3-glycerol-phosphate synthase [Candidatus Micrarchaeota archaeon]|nr:indole-3-glycerol-phosphate synthase [Candidatus Micrarchaeota archaeon]
MDILDKIAAQVRQTIDSGYYSCRRADESECYLLGSKFRSLSKKMRGGEFALISEIKPASPSSGRIFSGEIAEAARQMRQGGASAISVLTEPEFFGGELENITIAKRESGLPILMKDFIIEPLQLEAGARCGADIALLIVSLFERGYCLLDLDSMIERAHSLGMEVLLEAHTTEEFRLALDTEADILGINNRDLGSMEVSIGNTLEILSDAGCTCKGGCEGGERDAVNGKPVISESGISTREDVLRVKEAGAGGALIGTSILRSPDIAGKLRELVL